MSRAQIGVQSKLVRRTRRPLTVVGVLGELLLTAGVIVLLYVAWQMWIGDVIIGAVDNESGNQTSQEWAANPPPPPPPLVANPSDPSHAPVYEPPVLAPPEDGVEWAQMIIPRFGADYNRKIAGGVSRPNTLDNGWIGVYPNASMPGQIGNFSVAGHRTTWGAPLNQIDKLRLNDPIVIETEQGWYTYRFRTLEYVTPDRVDVLADVPQQPGTQTGERYITLTACSPLYSLTERIIAYGVFDSFHPRADGAPSYLGEDK